MDKKHVMCVCNIHIYLAIKKNEIMSFVEKCIELEIIMLSEISESHKQASHVFIYLWKLRKTKQN
jgi:hypothetical protein